MSKKINERIATYIKHKTSTLVDRSYLAIIDKIFDAENNDLFEIDSDNNIYISHSLKKDESIISDIQDLIADQIKRKYRKELEKQLEEEGYFVEFDDSDVNVYFEKPLKTDNSSNSSEQNILIYKKGAVPLAKLVQNTDSDAFDFGGEED